MLTKTDATKKINHLLSELVDINTHEAVRKKILEIIANETGFAYAFLVELEDDGVQMKVTTIYAPESVLNLTNKISGISLLGYRYPIDLDDVLKNPDIAVFQHVSDFYDVIPRTVGTLIEKTFGVKKIVSIRQRTKGTYLGAVNFIATSDETNSELLEYLCNNHLVYALRLMKAQSESAAQEAKYRASLEQRIAERTIELEQALIVSVAAEERTAQHYLNMEQARAEAEIRARETESLLVGLRTLSNSNSVDEIFHGILKVLKDALSYQDAFILIQREDGKLHPLASTARLFEKSVWLSQSFFQRVLSGKTLATYDVQTIPEWQVQPWVVQRKVCAALHVPLITQHASAMLICVHAERGFFAKQHLRLAEHFSTLAVQALQSAELYARLEEKNDMLEETVSMRTAEVMLVNQKLVEENLERRLAEQAALENELRYRSLFERTSDAIFFVNLDGTYLNANLQAIDMLGYQMDELLRLHMDDIVVSSDVDAVHSEIRALGKGQVYPVYQRNFRHKDGHIFPVEMNVALVYNDDGSPTHLQYIVRDISERVRNAEEIASLAKFPEENPTAVLRVSRTGKILYANPASDALLRVWDCCLGDALPDRIIHAVFDQAGLPQRKIVEENVGEEIYHLSFVPIEGADYINIYGRDVSAEKEAERTKAEFIAGVSHELRTPLAPILGWSEILLDGDPGELNEEQREFVQIIYDSGTHLHRIVDDLLDITSFEAGKFNIHKRKIAIREPIMKACKLVMPSANKKSIVVDINLPDSLPDIFADISRMEQVVLNLLSNAVKFTPDGGRVFLKAEEDAKTIKISVQDTGLGISPQSIEKIFSRFYRSESVVRASIQGTGLGLFISKEIVEAHGGRITVESVEGKGSIFEVILPLE